MFSTVKKISKTTAIAIATATLLHGVPVAFAQSGGTSLSMITPAQCIQSGQTIPVTVRLEGAVNVSTVQATIAYDSSVFDVSEKPTIGASFPLVFRNVTDPTAGKIELSASNASAVNGNADFATINFKAKKSGAAVINFDNNATIALGTDKENTNVLGNIRSLNLSACSGSQTTTSNSNTNSSNSSTQCSVPSGLSVKVRSSGVLLSWTNTDSRVDGHIVHYGIGNGSLDTAFLANSTNTQQTGNNYSLVLENIAPGKNYQVAVSAIGNCNESGNTPTVSFQSGNTSSGSSTSGGTTSGRNTTSWTGDEGNTQANGSISDNTTFTSQTHSSATNSKSAQLNASLMHGTTDQPPTGPKEALMVTLMIVVGVTVFYGALRRGKEME